MINLNNYDKEEDLKKLEYSQWNKNKKMMIWLVQKIQ
jgi:hypothetical protein